jgi:Ras-related C3 botulinum toxin substrate 1
MSAKSVKCVLVGDCGVGKRSLIITFESNAFPHEHIPGIMHPADLKVVAEGRQIGVQLWFAPAAEDYDRLRPLSYPDTDVFLVCFSVACPASFDNVCTKWIPELRHHTPSVPIVLVGTKTDLRGDASVVSCSGKQLRAACVWFAALASPPMACCS